MDDFTDDTTLVPPTLQLSPADRLRVFREDDAALEPDGGDDPAAGNGGDR
jgi:hypothetical protein